MSPRLDEEDNKQRREEGKGGVGGGDRGKQKLRTRENRGERENGVACQLF